MHVDSTRAVLALGGDDRIPFLQGILTQDVTLLREDRGLFAALLSPQGKILHDMFLLCLSDCILLDTDASQKEALLKRLTMYKLRAKVTLEDASVRWRVAYRTQATHAAVGHITRKKEKLVLTDPRAGELGDRIYLPPQEEAAHTASLDDYHRHRIRLGIPGTQDLDNDVAIDAGYDALNAISFTKGCYVGQEVTARMHYKNINRRGFYCVEADGDLPAPGAAIEADGQLLGTLRGSKGHLGLAMVKFDAVEGALETRKRPVIGTQAVQLRPPAWLQPKLAQFRAAQEKQ